MTTTPDPIYNPDNIPLFEALYGKHLISLGGFDAIDNMFSGIELRGKKALDIGFGLGGVAFYLAEKYHIEIAGIELHPWMAHYAKTHAPRTIASLLTFEVYNQKKEIPFTAGSFDLVYSKGVLNHVKEKVSLFKQIHNVLKPEGLFVIADWIHPETAKPTTGPLVNETKKTYQATLEKSGFTQITFRDDSTLFLSYVEKLLKNLATHEQTIKKEFGTDIFTTIFHDHQALIDAINRKQKYAIRIVAEKTTI